MTSKVCLDCGEEKTLEDFPQNKGRPDGRGAYCRPCFGVRSRASYARRRAAEGKVVRPIREVPDGRRFCPSCQAVKPLEDFPLNRASRSGRGGYCKPCHNVKGKQVYERLYGGTREYHLRRRYGITGAQYDQLVADQGGVCALCRQRAPQHVDHDHLTGRVRGVLCSCCNQGLGNFRDDAATLRQAADYVERLSVQRVREAPGVYRLVPPREPHTRPVADLAPLLAGRRGR